MYIFRWLDEGEDDGKLVRELVPYDEYDRELHETEKVKYDYYQKKTGYQFNWNSARLDMILSPYDCVH